MQNSNNGQAWYPVGNFETIDDMPYILYMTIKGPHNAAALQAPGVDVDDVIRGLRGYFWGLSKNQRAKVLEQSTFLKYGLGELANFSFTLVSEKEIGAEYAQVSRLQNYGYKLN